MSLGLHRRRHQATDVPHLPFYKDEKVIGTKITISVSVRLFILAQLLFVVAASYAFFTILRDDARLHDYLTSARKDRLANQHKLSAEINQLACYIIATLPNDPKRPIIKKVRDQYNCPPYGKDPNFKLYGPPEKSTAPSKSASPTPKATTSATAVAGGRPVLRTAPPAAVPVGASNAPAQPSPATSTTVVRTTATRTVSATPSRTSRPAPTPTPSSTAAPNPPRLLPSLIGIGGTCQVHVGNTCLIP